MAPIPVFLPGKLHEQRSLMGYGSWRCKESNMTEHTHIIISQNSPGYEAFYKLIIYMQNWCFKVSKSNSDFQANSLCYLYIAISSVQFSHSVVSDSLRPHESQHARPPCPSPTPRVYTNPCLWVSDAIQPSHPLSSPSPPAPSPSQHQGLFQWSTLLMRWPKYWSFSFSISPSNNTQDWSPLGWTGWISLQSKGLSRVFSNTTVQKHSK